MPRYQNDPRSITARFASTCKLCGGEIKKGEQIAYWPRTKSVYCWTCGEEPLREAQIAMAEEDAQQGWY